MANITNKYIDANGNTVFNASADKEDSLSLATANTYIDKNIIFNVNVNAKDINTTNAGSLSADSIENKTIYAENEVFDISTNEEDGLALATANAYADKKIIFNFNVNTEYLDTSDGTATADDIKKGQVAYANGNRIIGTHEEAVFTTEEITYIPPMSQRLEKVALYYGNPSSINPNTTDIEASAQRFAAYDIVIFGNGYQLPEQSSYSNTIAVINRIKQLSSTRIVGYVPIGMHPDSSLYSCLDIAEIKRRIDLWKQLNIDGIFLDEFGYDFYIDRERQNECVDYCHNNDMFVIANSWKPKYCFGTEAIVCDWMDGTMYGHSWNDGWHGNDNHIETALRTGDYYLWERIFFDYSVDKGQRYTRMSRMQTAMEYKTRYRDVYGVKSIALDSVPSTYSFDDMKPFLSFSLVGCAMLGIDGIAFGNEHWGSGGQYTDWDFPITEVLPAYNTLTTQTKTIGSKTFPYSFSRNLDGKTYTLTYNVESADDKTTPGILTMNGKTITSIYEENSGSSEPIVDDTIVEYSGQNDQVTQFYAAARSQYDANEEVSIIENYMTADKNGDEPARYYMNGFKPNSEIVLLDEVTGQAWVDKVTSSSYGFYNLVPNHVYTYYATASDGTRKIGRVKDTAFRRMIDLARPDNFRDLGGLACDGGTIKYGLIFRGEELHDETGSKLQGTDINILHDLLRIRTEVDLRAESDFPGADVEHSVIGSDVKYNWYPMTGAFSDVHLTGNNRTSIINALQTIMESVIESKPVYIHCISGAARTGTICALIEGILGCSWTDIDMDFELTSFNDAPPATTTSIKKDILARYTTYTDKTSTVRYDHNAWHYMQFKDGVKTLSGDNKFLNWFIEAGLPLILINRFRKAAIDGNPATLTVSNGGVIEENVNDMILTSLTQYGSLYNPGIGYRNLIRIRSNGEEEALSSSHVDACVTGFMAFKKGDTITFENIWVPSDKTEAGYNTNYQYIAIYDADMNFLVKTGLDNVYRTENNNVVDSDGHVTQATLNYLGSTVGDNINNMAYIRLGFLHNEGDPQPIIKKNVAGGSEQPDTPVVDEDNYLTSSVNADGSRFNNGLGYIDRYRLNSEGEAIVSNS